MGITLSRNLIMSSTRPVGVDCLLGLFSLWEVVKLATFGEWRPGEAARLHAAAGDGVCRLGKT